MAFVSYTSPLCQRSVRLVVSFRCGPHPHPARHATPHHGTTRNQNIPISHSDHSGRTPPAPRPLSRRPQPGCQARPPRRGHRCPGSSWRCFLFLLVCLDGRGRCRRIEAEPRIVSRSVWEGRERSLRCRREVVWQGVRRMDVSVDGPRVVYRRPAPQQKVAYRLEEAFCRSPPPEGVDG